MVDNSIDYMKLHSKGLKVRLKALSRTVAQYKIAAAKKDKEAMKEIASDIEDAAKLVDMHMCELLILRKDLTADIRKEFGINVQKQI